MTNTTPAPLAFDVLLTRDVTESALVRIVGARDSAHAMQEALGYSRKAILEGRPLAWVRDDCEGGEPYIADLGEELEPVDLGAAQSPTFRRLALDLDEPAAALVRDALAIVDPDADADRDTRDALESLLSNFLHPAAVVATFERFEVVEDAPTGKSILASFYGDQPRPEDGPYSPALAQAFRDSVPELQLDRLDVLPGALVEPAEGGAFVTVRCYVADGERLPMADEEGDEDDRCQHCGETAQDGSGICVTCGQDFSAEDDATAKCAVPAAPVAPRQVRRLRALSDVFARQLEESRRGDSGDVDAIDHRVDLLLEGLCDLAAIVADHFEA